MMWKPRNFRNEILGLFHLLTSKLAETFFLQIRCHGNQHLIFIFITKTEILLFSVDLLPWKPSIQTL